VLKVQLMYIYIAWSDAFQFCHLLHEILNAKICTKYFNTFGTLGEVYLKTGQGRELLTVISYNSFKFNGHAII